MTDYGRALEFGSFITPAAGSARGVMELTKASERAGLDYATFQDHPYQPAFFDTWTLLSYLAAQTSTIRLAANVHNLPLRPPAVLARSAASLDILSGGRIELGLGAGGFWDAIEAMGGGRLTPGQSVTALSEAIDVIKGIWDAGNRERYVYEGEFYKINGAKRGPAPAHDMEIWLGGYKPRMLRLIGTKATGWLPSLSYLPDLKDLSVANAAIDQAALNAGRDPKVIRRLLNVGGQITNAPTSKPLVGPVQQWIDDLVSMALEHGMDTFILGGDSVQMLEIYGNEIIPAVREIVAQERGTNGLGA